MSTIEDFQSATFAAIPHDDLTVGEAWASSPLGDPSIEDGSLSEPAKFEDFPPTTVTAEPRSRATNALLAAAVVAGVGMFAGLGMMLFDGTGSKQEKPAVVVPNSSVGSVTPQAPSAIPPSPVAPAPVASPDAGQPPSAPVSGGGAPAWTVPAPAPAPVVGAAPADPGTPPDAPADPGTPPPPPSVTVNIPPVVVPVPIPVPVPTPPSGGGQQGGGQQGGGLQGGGAQQGGGHGPIQCLACQQHPIQQQPIHPQPVQQQPVHPQPVQQQPIHPQPIPGKK